MTNDEEDECQNSTKAYPIQAPGQVLGSSDRLLLLVAFRKCGFSCGRGTRILAFCARLLGGGTAAGAGLSLPFVAAVPSLAQQDATILWEHMRVFISHAVDDRELVEAFVDLLRLGAGNFTRRHLLQFDLR